MEAASEVEAAFIEMTGESGKAILDQMKADLAGGRLDRSRMPRPGRRRPGTPTPHTEESRA